MVTERMSTGVTRFLEGANISFRAHMHAPVRNAQEAREAGLPFDLHLLTKTLVYRLPASWLLVWMRALDRVNHQALARAAGQDRRKIRFAADHEVQAVLGWEPGGAAPLPLVPGVELLVDEALARLPTVYFGGGRRDLTIELEPAALLARVPHSLAALTRGTSGAAGL